MSFDNRYIAPGASGGSQIDPAFTAMLIVTAGVVGVRLPRTTIPLSRVERVGSRPECVTQATGSGSNQPTVRFDSVSVLKYEPPYL